MIVITFAFLVLFVFKSTLSYVSLTLTQPLYVFRHYLLTSSATVPVFLRSRLELLEHIQSLEAEVALSHSTATTVRYLEEENAELRATLGATTTPHILAGVIARPPYTPYDTIMLDRGENDGVVLNAPVYHHTNAVGYVRSVFSHTSLVTLFSTPTTEATVYVFGANIFATAYGEGGGIIRISVPQGVPLEVGEPVILPSLNTGVLGTITHIQSIPTEPEQHAYVTLSAPLQSLRIVHVGTQPVEETSFEVAKERVQDVRTTLFTIPVPASAWGVQAGTTSATEYPVSATST